MKQMLSVRVSVQTLRQLTELAQAWGTTQTGVVAIALDRAHREEVKQARQDEAKEPQP